MTITSVQICFNILIIYDGHILILLQDNVSFPSHEEWLEIFKPKGVQSCGSDHIKSVTLGA
jgi:hypothetical protein